MLIEGGETTDARVMFAFRLATSRPPSSNERALLTKALAALLTQYQQDESAAKQLVSAGDSPRDPRLSPTELAAYTALANLILNLDETMTKE